MEHDEKNMFPLEINAHLLVVNHDRLAQDKLERKEVMDCQWV